MTDMHTGLGSPVWLDDDLWALLLGVLVLHLADNYTGWAAQYGGMTTCGYCWAVVFQSVERICSSSGLSWWAAHEGCMATY